LSTELKSSGGAPAPDAPIRKFMFERSFENDAGHRAPLRERRPVTLTPEQFDALKKEAYDGGFAAAQKASVESQAQHLNIAVDRIGNHIGLLLQQTEAERQHKEIRVREAVLSIARKVLPDYNQRHGMQEIEAVVAGIIGEMANEPRLVVRVNETQFDQLNESLKAVTEKQGYAGKVVLLADAEIRLDDCRIEWADGGIERNLEALWKNVGRAIAPDAAPPPSTETTPEEIKNG
jgi:flagellar assembly protein FliH